jgi:hypothetical protein
MVISKDRQMDIVRSQFPYQDLFITAPHSSAAEDGRESREKRANQMKRLPLRD